MAHQTTLSANPDEAALAKRTRKAMQSIERQEKARQKDNLLMGMAFDSFGSSASDGKLSGVIRASRLVVGGIALMLCAYAFWHAL